MTLRLILGFVLLPSLGRSIRFADGEDSRGQRPRPAAEGPGAPLPVNPIILAAARPARDGGAQSGVGLTGTRMNLLRIPEPILNRMKCLPLSFRFRKIDSTHLKS